MKKLISTEDESVNFVSNNGQESRYVHRPDTDYFVVYLSSHGGCNKACRFCHLTATGQTEMISATIPELMLQAMHPLAHNLDGLNMLPKPKIHKVNFNFMARGEPLSNPHVVAWQELEDSLALMAECYGISDYQFNISTIMPDEADLTNLNPETVTLYYSLYSLNPKFRRRWLPKAQNPYRALRELAVWQDRGGKVVIHHPFIKGENDDYLDVIDTVMAVEALGLKTRYNLVRYNPPEGHYSEESDNLEENFSIWKNVFPESKIITRVGLDVKASCGMFVS